MHGFVLRDVRQAHQYGDHGVPREIDQGVFKVAVCILVEVAQDTGVKLFFVEARFQVDQQAVLRLPHAPHVGARGEDQRTRDAEVRKQHLAQFPVNELVVLVGRERHVLEGEALHLGASLVRAFKRHEGRAARRDRVAQLLGEAVARSGGAGQRIAESTGADGGGAAREIALSRHDSRHGAVFGDNLLCSGFHGLHPRLAAEGRDRRRHVVCVVRLRKDAVSALGLQRQARIFKEGHGVGGAETVQGAVEETAVAGDVCHHGLHVAVVGEVAAALARDAELAAQLVVRLQEHSLHAAVCRLIRAHHARGAAADDDKLCGFKLHM